MNRPEAFARASLAACVGLGIGLAYLFVSRLDGTALRGPQGIECMASALCAAYGIGASLLSAYTAVREANAATRPTNVAVLGTAAVSSHLAAVAYASLVAAPSGALRNVSVAYAFFAIAALVARSASARDPESGKELV